MHSLILTILSIALLSAVAVASVNYLPWWQKSANDTAEIVRKSMASLERSYELTLRAANGIAPPVTGSSADGGLMAGFGSVLRFAPAAPAGYRWKYGQRTTPDGSLYEGLHYFCLEPSSESAGLEKGIYQGVVRAVAVYSPEQAILAEECGATSRMEAPSEFPSQAKVTLFVTYTPEMSR